MWSSFLSGRMYFEWYMSMLAVKNKHQKYTSATIRVNCVFTILLTIVGLIVNKIKRAYVTTHKER